MIDSLFQLFDNLNVWRSRNKRAPHKPLLALWAIGQCLEGRERLIKYDSIHKPLLRLLKRFGPLPMQSGPNVPFWRMQKDKIWDVTEAHRIQEGSDGDVRLSDLRKFKCRGGFPLPIYGAFRRDPVLALQIAHNLVDDHFPGIMRRHVLEATLGKYAVLPPTPWFPKVEGVGIPQLDIVLERQGCYSSFKTKVLESYDYRCAVCNYSIEYPVGIRPALEAAHIRWRSHDGLDDSNNGLSLCALHHELFDSGIFTVRPGSFKIEVAESVLDLNRDHPDNPITKLNNQELRSLPRRRSDRPGTANLEWHSKNVFRGVL